MIPKKIFLTKGVGKSKNKLESFELALRDAGIAHFNLVTVSSILPPHCKMITKEEGLKQMSPGQIVFVVMARIESNEPNRLIASSVGVAIPQDRSQYGYLSEFHDFGYTEEKAGDYAEDLAASMLASTLGMDFDPEVAWNEREQHFKMSGKIVSTRNITKTAICDKEGKWTTVLSAAILLE